MNLCGMICYMYKIKALIKKCRESKSYFIIVVVRYLFYKISGRNILANHRVTIDGVKKIHTNGLLQVGMNSAGFMHRHDRTYLNIRGNLVFEGDYSIGKGCRIVISDGAVARFGSGYTNSNTNFIIMHGITIGNGCAISWNCQFLDEDFHNIYYKDKKEKSPSIEIGDHVWIGSNVSILKGSRIADGCVVASGSVVSSVFDRANCLVAGNPAKVIRENITWE